MSDEQDKPDDGQPEEEPQGPRGGERLAEARRRQQISVLEVAKELHLDEPKVRALERNEFGVLGAPVFAKGHLRKYAQLVGVDEADVFADYYQLTRSQGIPPLVATARSKVRQELSPGPWIAIIIVILALAAAYWWFAVRSETAVFQETIPESTPESAPEESVSLRPSRETVVLAAATENATLPSDAPAVETSQPSPEPDNVLADDEIVLSMDFSGDCWTEISDASGRRLFFDMGRDGRSVEVSGKAPFAVLFGNVDNVDVRVNGNDFPISTTNPGGRTARLTIMNP
jgi:cytoskeleton protein RodZ